MRTITRLPTVIFLVAACLTDLSLAHSWVRCTDYRVENARAEPQGPDETDPLRRQYDESACFGYSPSFADDTAFAQDDGFDQQLGETRMCGERENTYSESRPMAAYTAGSTVCLAYPAKNHVAAECTNSGIPDTDLSIYRSNVGASNDTFASSDEFLSNELTHLNGVHASNTIDYLGFQNCPDFCGDAGTDAALCTVCFELESDLTPGMYQFAWRWEFNQGQHYSTCWSADVQADALDGAAISGGDGSTGDGLGTGASIGITLVVLLVVLGGATLAYNMWWKKRPSAVGTGTTSSSGVANQV